MNFRIQWKDDRLAPLVASFANSSFPRPTNGTQETKKQEYFLLELAQLNKIWVPDVYFGKKGGFCLTSKITFHSLFAIGMKFIYRSFEGESTTGSTPETSLPPPLSRFLSSVFRQVETQSKFLQLQNEHAHLNFYTLFSSKE